MDRSRFVLKYITETNRIICKVCIGLSREDVHTFSCFYSSCAILLGTSGLYISRPHHKTIHPLFDNTKHRIITTLDFCHGKDFGCRLDCKTNCMVPIVQEKFKI